MVLAKKLESLSESTKPFLTQLLLRQCYPHHKEGYHIPGVKVSLPQPGCCLTKGDLDTIYRLLSAVIRPPCCSSALGTLPCSFLYGLSCVPRSGPLHLSSLYLEGSSPRSAEQRIPFHLSALHPALLPTERPSLIISSKAIPAHICPHTFPSDALCYYTILFSPLRLLLSVLSYLFLYFCLTPSLSCPPFLFIA